MFVTSSVLWHGMKCAILLNLSTTTKIESLPLFVLGSPKIKSIDMSTHGSLGTGKGVYNPCGKTLDLAFLHVIHLPQMRFTSFFILGQKKLMGTKVGLALKIHYKFQMGQLQDQEPKISRKQCKDWCNPLGMKLARAQQSKWV